MDISILLVLSKLRVALCPLSLLLCFVISIIKDVHLRLTVELHTMPRGPRRAPPSALRLVQGPLPPRATPKHTLPSLPCPAFRPDAILPHGPIPQSRIRRADSMRATFPDLPPLDLEIANTYRSSSSTPTSPISGHRSRGPWNHSSSISVQVDIDSLIALPKPAAFCL